MRDPDKYTWHRPHPRMGLNRPPYGWPHLAAILLACALAQGSLWLWWLFRH